MPSRRRLAVANAAGLTVLALLTPHAWADYEVPNPAFNPPANYYNLVTGSPTTVKQELYSTISVGWNEATQTHVSNATNWIPRTYGDLRYAARVLFKDTSWVPTAQDPYDHILWVYDRSSHDYQWDAGSSWNREHAWPQSKLGATASNGTANRASDLFVSFPADSSTNSSRGNAAYGLYPFTGSPGLNSGYYYPGNVDRGDIARTLFYMATRYGEGQGGLGNLTLGDGQGGTNAMGDLTSLLHWNYEDGVDNFERRRSWLAMSQDTTAAGWDIAGAPAPYNQAYYQGNRNPFIDHPEYVWSAFGGGNNNSRIYLGATNPPDGTSSQNASLGRVMKNGAFGTTSVTITKTGTTPTTYDITLSGSATTTAAGTGQPFNYNGVTRNISVGLTGGTSTTGIKSGAITINNTDLSTAAAGTGSADGNDTINVSGTVVDNRVISASAANFGRVVIGANVTAGTALSSPGDDNNNTRITVKATASAADGNGVFITAGSDVTFNGAVTNSNRTLQGNFANPGSYSGSRTFTIQGESLAGEVDAAVSASYSATALAHAQPSFANGSSQTSQSVDFGYVPSGFTARTASFNIYNNAAPAGATLTAGLDIDGASGSTAQMTTNVIATNPATPLGADASPLSYTATFTPTTGGNANATHAISSSDENIPGAANRPNLSFAANGYTLTSATFPTTGFMKLFSGEIYNTGPFAIQPGVMLTYNGSGTMNIDGAQSNGAGSVLSASDGVINFNTDAGSPGAPALAVSSSGSANVTFNATQHLASLTIAGTTVSVAPGADKTIVTSALTNTGRLDLLDNKLIVRNGGAGSWNGSAYTGVAGQVQSARNGGGWSSPGITTSQTDATTGNYTTLAVASASDAKGIDATATTTWSGEVVSGSDTLVMYTYGGDANLDGKLNIDDYARIDQGIAAGSSGYAGGDFNYDGKINIDDYTVIDSNIVAQGAPFNTTSSFTAQSVASVPEPVGVALIAGVAGFLLRRSRKR